MSKAGAVVTPLNPAYRDAEAGYQLGNSEARIVIVHQEKFPIIEAVRTKVPAVKHVIVVGSERPPPPI